MLTAITMWIWTKSNIDDVLDLYIQMWLIGFALFTTLTIDISMAWVAVKIAMLL